MKHLVTILLTALVAMATACNGGSAKSGQASVADTIAQTIQDTSTLCGTWVRPTALKDTVEGFTLLDGGKAVSVNLPKMSYTWWQATEKPDSITLIASVAQRDTTVLDTMRYAYRFIRPDSLILLTGGKPVAAYTRKR